MKAANRGLSSAYAHAGVLTADVAATFQIGDFDYSVAVPGLGRIPVNVTAQNFDHPVIRPSILRTKPARDPGTAQSSDIARMRPERARGGARTRVGLTTEAAKAAPNAAFAIGRRPIWSTVGSCQHAVSSRPERLGLRRHHITTDGDGAIVSLVCERYASTSRMEAPSDPATAFEHRYDYALSYSSHTVHS